MTRNQVKKYRKELTALLNGYGEENGVQVSIGSIRFTENEFHTRLTLVEAGSKEDAQRIAFERDCAYYAHIGLTPEHYGRTFVLDGRKAKVVGLKPKSPKYPLVVEIGKQKYKARLTEDTVASMK